jgi:Fic family protein
MKIPPEFAITHSILSLLSEIESIRLYVGKSNIHTASTFFLRRNSFLKSSLYSARIEGNTLSELSLQEENTDAETKEIINIMKALEYIDTTSISVVNHEMLKKLHSIIGEQIFPDKGSYRTEVSGIFNTAGAVVYMPPPPTQVKKLLDELISYIQHANTYPLITAFITHLIFEKIHPFLDGNGRVGRALIPAVLKAKRYEVPFPVTIEEYLDTHRNEYYDVLLNGMRDTERYLEFMMLAYLAQMKKTVTQLEELSQKSPLMLELTARQEEIYLIIKEQRSVSLNFITRRFLKVNERTLRNDLTKLIEKKLVTKVGNTKGVEYRVV